MMSHKSDLSEHTQQEEPGRPNVPVTYYCNILLFWQFPKCFSGVVSTERSDEEGPEEEAAALPALHTATSS